MREDQEPPYRPKAIIIGASSGIGAALATVLAAEGYRLGLAARRQDRLESLRESLGEGHRVAHLDLDDPELARSALERLIHAMEGVDLIVIAAGTGALNTTLDWSLERQTLATNVVGFCAVAVTAMRHFMVRRSGHLVAISSVAGIRGGRAAPAYNASKAFVSNYLEGLRQGVTRVRVPITVTDIRPGFVDTDMAKGEGLFWVASSLKAARQIATAIRRERACAYITRRWRLVAWLLRIMPEAFYRRL